MIWEKIRGHARQVEMFRRTIGRRRLSHSYLFLGPDGIGKKMFARALAQCLFCQRFADTELEACDECSSCRQMLAGSHPDFFYLSRPQGKNVLSIDLFVGSIERRGREGLCYELSLRPMSAGRKVAVIDDANLMNEESSNALLKTLEEPLNDSVLILVAPSPDGLLPTIRSRCQQVRFAPLPVGELAELLIDLEIASDRNEAAEVASLSQGSLTVAGQLLDPGLRQLRESLYNRLADQDFNSLRTAVEMLKGLEKLGGDAQAQRNNAQWLVGFTIEFYSRTLRRLAGDVTNLPIEPVRRFSERFRPATTEHSELVMELLDRSASAMNQLKRWTPIPICLEGLFDNLGRLMRSAAARDR